MAALAIRDDVAMGEGKLYLGQLDADIVAFDIKTGKEV